MQDVTFNLNGSANSLEGDFVFNSDSTHERDNPYIVSFRVKSLGSSITSRDFTFLIYTKNVEDDIIVSIVEEPANEAAIRIYPNPFSDYLIVHSSQRTKGMVIFYNVLGDRLKTFQWSNDVRIPIQDLQLTAEYLLYQIFEDGRLIKFGKLIRQ